MCVWISLGVLYTATCRASPTFPPYYEQAGVRIWQESMWATQDVTKTLPSRHSWIIWAVLNLVFPFFPGWGVSTLPLDIGKIVGPLPITHNPLPITHSFNIGAASVAHATSTTSHSAHDVHCTTHTTSTWALLWQSGFLLSIGDWGGQYNSTAVSKAKGVKVWYYTCEVIVYYTCEVHVVVLIFFIKMTSHLRCNCTSSYRYTHTWEGKKVSTQLDLHS